jgi:uncharacterized protein YigE (DUF2233 family)
VDESRSFRDTSGSEVRTSIVTIDLERASLRIVSVPFESRSKLGDSELSLREFAGDLAQQARFRSREWLAVNGGFSSYRVDVPLGLLVVDGKVYSKLSKEKLKGRSGSSTGEVGRLRWSGVLCQLSKGGKWQIIFAANYLPGSCWQALQAGPFLVEPGSLSGIAQGEPESQQPSRRTVVCLTGDGRMVWVVTRDQTHLLPLADWLRRPNAEAGVGCREALNLSGGTSSGLAIRSGKGVEPRFIGEGSFPLPSAILAEGIRIRDGTSH